MGENGVKMKKAPNSFLKYTARGGEPSQLSKTRGEPSTSARATFLMVQWIHVSVVETGKGRHIMNGVSAATIGFLVLLVCVVTLVLLKYGVLVVFYYGFPLFLHGC